MWCWNLKHRDQELHTPWLSQPGTPVMRDLQREVLICRNTLQLESGLRGLVLDPLCAGIRNHKLGGCKKIIYCLPVLEATCLKLRCHLNCAPSGACTRKFFLSSSSFCCWPIILTVSWLVDRSFQSLLLLLNGGLFGFWLLILCFFQFDLCSSKKDCSLMEARAHPHPV